MPYFVVFFDPDTHPLVVNFPDTFGILVNNAGCADSARIIVLVYDNPELGNSLPLCDVVNGYVLDAEIDNVTYSWSTGATSQTIVIFEPVLYTGNVQKGNCTLSDSVVVDGFLNGTFLYALNAFTSDQNGLNDVFRVKGSGVTTLHMSIFNRWGELIDESYDISKGWDGTYKREIVQEDSHIYTIEYTVLRKNEKILNRTGYINLIR
jgi:gliding motility-associated-like protein